MCKYCKLETLREKTGEKSNGNPTIAKIKDGSHVYEVCMNRYICESDKVHDRSLFVALDVDFGGGSTLPLKSKSIKIKYCPFCGEEL